MKNEYMLSFIKKKVDEIGVANVAVALGYRSSAVIYQWLDADRIPPIAIEKVQNYIEREKKK